LELQKISRESIEIDLKAKKGKTGFKVLSEKKQSKKSFVSTEPLSIQVASAKRVSE